MANFLKKSSLKLSNFVSLKDGFLNKTTGTVSPVLSDLIEGEADNTITIVTGVDEQKIDLNLISEGKRTEPIAGFLVEVYLSGTDGKLTRLYKEDRIDINGNVIDESFESYFSVELDK